MNADYVPGELGFDPLGLFPKDPEEAFDKQSKEINNGRLAMISIVGFAAQARRFFTQLTCVTLCLREHSACDPRMRMSP